MVAISRTKRAPGAGLLIAFAVFIVMVATAGGAGARSDAVSALPRAQTLYVSGKQWGPYTDFNPFRQGDYATGVLGLVYETLFRYDPLKDRFIPWLATKGSWSGKTYVVTLRNGVRWSDGTPLTAADVKFSFETGKLAGSEFATMWQTGLRSVTTSGNQVRFQFSGTPNYQQWDTFRYSMPIVPRHIWSAYSAKAITTGNNDDMSKLIGTGPFAYGAGKGGSQTLQWNRRDGWWATAALGMRMPMRYIVDIHNTSNTASLQNFLQSKIDLSNNFFPGIDRMIRGKVQTYYSRAPYMLAANTAWLVPNTTKKPLDDRNFRRALAFSINVGRIVKDDYGNIVSKASPTGLLPTWSKWVDKSLVR
jgi:peptide/nickel transport system substrate-binding protein